MLTVSLPEMVNGPVSCSHSPKLCCRAQDLGEHNRKNRSSPRPMESNLTANTAVRRLAARCTTETSILPLHDRRCAWAIVRNTLIPVAPGRHSRTHHLHTSENSTSHTHIQNTIRYMAPIALAAEHHTHWPLNAGYSFMTHLSNSKTRRSDHCRRACVF